MLACIFADDSEDAGIQWSMGTTMRLGSQTFVAPISLNGLTSCARASWAMATSTLQSTTSPTLTPLLPDLRARIFWGRVIGGVPGTGLPTGGWLKAVFLQDTLGECRCMVVGLGGRARAKRGPE